MTAFANSTTVMVFALEPFRPLPKLPNEIIFKIVEFHLENDFDIALCYRDCHPYSVPYNGLVKTYLMSALSLAVISHEMALVVERQTGKHFNQATQKAHESQQKVHDHVTSPHYIDLDFFPYCLNSDACDESKKLHNQCEGSRLIAQKVCETLRRVSRMIRIVEMREARR